MSPRLKVVTSAFYGAAIVALAHMAITAQDLDMGYLPLLFAGSIIAPVLGLCHNLWD